MKVVNGELIELEESEKLLETIDFSAEIRSTNVGVFERNKNLKTVNLNPTLRIINHNLFKDCENLTQVELPARLYFLGSYVFQNCKKLEHIKIGNRITSLCTGLFDGCENLKDVKLPDNLEYVGDQAFKNCKSLKEINLPNSVKSIGLRCFDGCEGLQTLTLPKKLKNIEASAPFNYLNFFDGCFVLSVKKIDENSIQITNNPKLLHLLINNWKIKEDILRYKNNQKLIETFYYCFSIMDFTVDDRFENFVQKSNLKFFKQLDLQKLNSLQVKNLTKLLFSLGGFKNEEEFVKINKAGKKNKIKINYGQKACEFFKELENSGISLCDIANMYKDSVITKFNFELSEFILNKQNFKKIFEIEKYSKGFFKNIIENFETVQKAHTSDKGSQRQLAPTVEKFYNYFYRKKFSGVTEQTKEIADIIAPYFDKQEDFEEAVKILNQAKCLNKTSILNEELKEEAFDKIEDYEKSILKMQKDILGDMTTIASKNFKFEYLDKKSPLNLILGKLCNCCAHLNGAGYCVMKSSIVHPNMQNLVIKNVHGEIVAKSTLFINPHEQYGLFNTVEICKDVSEEDKKIVLNKFILGVNKFVEKYNINHPNRPLKQIAVGMGHNDLFKQLSKFPTLPLLKNVRFDDYHNPNSTRPNIYEGDTLEYQTTIWQSGETK